MVARPSDREQLRDNPGLDQLYPDQHLRRQTQPTAGRSRALRAKHGSGDNTGMEPIRSWMRTDDFSRIRFGRGQSRLDPVDFVPSNSPTRQHADIEIKAARAADTVEALMHSARNPTKTNSIRKYA